MRWIFYILLAANAAFLATEIRDLQPPAIAPAVEMPMPGTVNRLLLLSELEDGELRERRSEPAAAPAVVESPQSAAADVAVASDTVGSIAAAIGSAVASMSETAARTATRVCYSVGPLEGTDEIESMRAWLGERDGFARLREDERRETALYWVYFPPLPSRNAAVERVERLREQNVEDIFIIPRGDMQNAISLGVYSRQDSLERRLTELRGRGYEPAVDTRYRTRRAAWFDADFDVDFSFAADAFAAVFPSVSLEPVACTEQQLLAAAARLSGAGADAASAGTAEPAPAAPAGEATQ